MKGTVKSKDDMERLFREGRRSSSYMFSVLKAPSPDQYKETGRCAFIAGKKLGTAPFRSRCKRVMRAAAHELGAPWQGYDIVFVARNKVATAPHEKVVSEMARVLKKLDGQHEGR